MCHECDDLQEQIRKFQRFIAQPLDALTTGRLTAAVVEMEAKKAALHPLNK